VGLHIARTLLNQPLPELPPTTMIGALVRYISDVNVRDFQPMGANFGLLPPLDTQIRDKRLRYEALAERALLFLKEK
jgi:methylenetetrahydrofolate--tRNA-(uracil-5-)-methyltransferase